MLKIIYRCFIPGIRRRRIIHDTTTPQFDAVFEKALTETNDSLRYRLYRQADSIMMADAPVVPLWYDMVVHLVQPYVKDFPPNALNLLELRYVKKER